MLLVTLAIASSTDSSVSVFYYIIVTLSIMWAY